MSDSSSSDAVGDDVTPAVPPSGADHHGHGHDHDEVEHALERVRHTRTSAAWVATVVAVLFGVALIDFIAQNTHDVRIEFFWAKGQIPVAVALLAAALCGAVVVVSIGIGRVAQLRLSMRRERRRVKPRRGEGSVQDS
jgi:uncharacterized integral membrane protein